MKFLVSYLLFFCGLFTSMVSIPTTFRKFNTTASGRKIYGEIIYTPPPKAGNYFSFQIPEGECKDRAATSKTSKYHGCQYATNAGFFNMDNGDCLGNVISDGRLIQRVDTNRVNFGVQKNGDLWVGYVDDSFDFNNYEQLLTGQCWLVKDGKNNVDQCMRDEEIGSGFVNLIAPRLALGFDSKQGIMQLGVDGDEGTRQGINLYDFADLAVSLGLYQVINLDGGGSLAVVANGETENSCSGGCYSGNIDYPCPAFPGYSEKVCERLVTTITCVK